MKLNALIESVNIVVILFKSQTMLIHADPEHKLSVLILHRHNPHIRLPVIYLLDFPFIYDNTVPVSSCSYCWLAALIWDFREV
jgi:hypothetical protein